MSHIEYQLATMMTDRMREARDARWARAPRQRSRLTLRWPSRQARLRVRPA